MAEGDRRGRLRARPRSRVARRGRDTTRHAVLRPSRTDVVRREMEIADTRAVRWSRLDLVRRGSVPRGARTVRRSAITIHVATRDTCRYQIVHTRSAHTQQDTIVRARCTSLLSSVCSRSRGSVGRCLAAPTAPPAHAPALTRIISMRGGARSAPSRATSHRPLHIIAASRPSPTPSPRARRAARPYLASKVNPAAPCPPSFAHTHTRPALRTRTLAALAPLSPTAMQQCRPPRCARRHRPCRPRRG